MIIKFKDASVHIKELQYGVVIELVYNEGKRTFGHIIGFSRNHDDEIILNISVENRQRIIHPANLIFNI